MSTIIVLWVLKPISLPKIWFAQHDYHNGHPIAGAPLESGTDKKMYLISIRARTFRDVGYGISFEEYTNHYLLVFDLSSTQPASHDYLHPEHTSAAIAISLRFDTALAN